MKKISELVPGDEAYILNGKGNGVKRVTVIEAAGELVRVSYVDARGTHTYDFSREDGTAVWPEALAAPALGDKDPPRLYAEKTGRIEVIEQRARHHAYRARAEKYINAYTEQPTQENYESMLDILSEWHDFSNGLQLWEKIGTLAGEADE